MALPRLRCAVILPLVEPQIAIQATRHECVFNVHVNLFKVLRLAIWKDSDVGRAKIFGGLLRVFHVSNVLILIRKDVGTTNHTILL